MKPYKKYKKTNIPWLEEVPEHWEIKRLKEILIERKESNFPVKTSLILSLTNTKGVIPYSEKGNIGNKSKSDITGYRLAYPNDIVLNSMNVVIGSVGLSKYFGAVSPVYYTLYLRKSDSIEYYCYIFKEKRFQLSLKGLGNGILDIRMRIPMNKLNNVELPIPSRSEQDHIVRYLDWQITKINKLVKAKKKQIELLKEYKHAVINKAVTKGLDDSAPMKDSGIEWLGEVPESWEVRNLGSFSALQNGISEAGDFFTKGFPFVNYGDVYKNFHLPKTVEGLANSTKKQQEIYSVEEGDIFFTRTSETKEDIARSSVALNTIPNAVFSGFVIRVRPHNGIILKNFSEYYFRNELLRNYFVQEMNIVTRASLSQGLLRNLPVVLPPLKKQQAIVDYLNDITAKIDTTIAEVEQEITLISEYKTSLISSVVTGKVDVRDVVVPDFIAEDEIVEEVEEDEEEGDE